MKKKTVIIIISAVILAILIAGYFFFNARSPGLRKGMKSTMSNAANGSMIKLSDTTYWNYAHLISGDTLDNSATKALAGFKLEKQNLADGSMQITLKALSSGYRDQTYTVEPGQQLYFIETSYGDDVPDNDYSLGDDLGVVVDSEGYIVK